MFSPKFLNARDLILWGAVAFWIAQLMVPFSYLQFWYIRLYHCWIPGVYPVIAVWNVLLLALAFWAEPFFFQKPWSWMWISLLGGSLLPSTICGVDPFWSLRNWLVFLNRGFLIGFILFFIAVDIKSFERAIKLFYWVALVMAAMGLLEIFLGRPLLDSVYKHALEKPLIDRNALFRTNMIGVQSIPVGGVGNRIPFTSCLVAFFPISIWYWEGHRKYYLLGVAMMISTIFLSLARSSYLGVLVATVVYLMGRHSLPVPVRWKESTLLAMLLLLALLAIPKPRYWWFDLHKELALVQIWPTSLDRMQDLNTAHRLASYQTVLRIFRKYPLGIGLGTYQQIYRDFQTFRPSVLASSWPDNQYLRWLAETGVVGGVLLSCFLGIYARRMRRMMSWRGMDQDANLLWAVFSGVAGLLTCFIFFDGFYWTGPTVTLWAMIGLSWACAEKRMSNMLK